MQDVLTYEAWLDAVCHICNSLLKANVNGLYLLIQNESIMHTMKDETQRWAQLN